MPTISVSKDHFFEKLGTHFQSIYGTDNVFSLIVLEFFPVSKNVEWGQMGVIVDFIYEKIADHISRDSDYFAFWGNKFFICSADDSKEKIQEFIIFISSVLEKEYPAKVYMKAGFAQYPYDALEVCDLLDMVRENSKIYTNFKSVKKSQDDVGIFHLGSSKASNMEVINQVHGLMKELRHYDQYLFEHNMLVAQGSVYFAKELGLEANVVRKIAAASLLHDIGYLNIPSTIINKTDKLSPREWALVKIHPILATRNILKKSKTFRDIFPIIEQHHEFIDGSGYPFGLKADEVLAEAQVISIVDTYQAVSVQRSYRRALPFEETLDIFLRNAGVKWQEDLVTIFLAILGDENQMKNLIDNNFKDVSELFDLI